MILKEGKNFKLINEFGINYKLKHANIDDFYIFIYHRMDLEVTDFKDKKEDFWLAMKDLDGEYFVQPISGHMLAIKLMSKGYIPV